MGSSTSPGVTAIISTRPQKAALSDTAGSVSSAAGPPAVTGRFSEALAR